MADIKYEWHSHLIDPTGSIASDTVRLTNNNDGKAEPLLLRGSLEVICYERLSHPVLRRYVVSFITDYYTRIHNINDILKFINYHFDILQGVASRDIDLTEFSENMHAHPSCYGVSFSFGGFAMLKDAKSFAERMVDHLKLLS